MKFYLKNGVSLLLLPLFYLFYLATRINTQIGTQIMVNSFLVTGGRVNELVVSARRLFVGKGVTVNGGIARHVLPMDIVVNELESKGYVVLKEVIGKEILDEILEFTRHARATVRRTDDGETRGERVKFDVDNLLGVRYDYGTEEIINNHPIQKIFASDYFINIAREYLGVEPRLDEVGLWWSANFYDRPEDHSAQFFHFDLDRFKWLKIFVYLTDVGVENGPHEFVSGSHKVDGLPKSIRDKGYARLDDQEVIDLYGQEHLVKMVGEAGTVIIEDTRGLHKGNRVECDPRLILQVQFSADLFGAVTRRATINEINSCECLKKRLNSRERSIFSGYLP